MNITIKQPDTEIIYVENIYEGNLARDLREAVESISWADWFERWLNYLSPTTEQASNCELSMKLISDRQIQSFNRQYRYLDQPTDVLAFAATEADIAIPADLAEPLYLGDILISLDTAVKQATEQNHSLIVELAWLATHGLLHLLGWDHPDEGSLQQMLDKQEALIKLLNLQSNILIS